MSLDEMWSWVIVISVMTGWGGYVALLIGAVTWDHKSVIHGGAMIIVSMCVYAIATKRQGV